MEGVIYKYRTAGEDQDEPMGDDIGDIIITSKDKCTDHIGSIHHLDKPTKLRACMRYHGFILYRGDMVIRIWNWAHIGKIYRVEAYAKLGDDELYELSYEEFCNRFIDGEFVNPPQVKSARNM